MRAEHTATGDDRVTRWNISDLVEVVPNSTVSFWRAHIPKLVAAGALKKSGKCWLGRRNAIEEALLATTDGAK